MGDIKTGLIVGGTVQLMSLGVAGFAAHLYRLWNVRNYCNGIW